MRQLPCPHCYERPTSLDMHLRFDCPKLVGRSRYVAPEPEEQRIPVPVLERFFAELDEFLLTSQP